MSRDFSRRAFLRGAGMAAGLVAAGRLPGFRRSGVAHAAEPSEASAVFLVYLRGGYNALFPSANSFLASGAFGVRDANVLRVGASDLYVDKASLGALGPFALGHMASIGVKHGISAHPTAQLRNWMDGTRSFPIRLAAALPGTAAIRCAAVGPMPPGTHRAEGDVSMQQVRDLATTIAALGGSTAAVAPERGLAASGLDAAREMSAARLAVNPESGRSLAEAYPASVAMLTQATQTFDYAEIAAAYGIAQDAAGRYPTAVKQNFRMMAAGAEIMIRAGANVVTANIGGWDSHGDRDGSEVRGMMADKGITAGLRAFVERTAAMTDKNVVTVVFGDFSRSLPGSDHQANLTATVIGKYVQVGTTGKVSGTVGLPAGTPGIEGFWSYVAAAAKAPTNPFGANPHGLVV